MDSAPLLSSPPPAPAPAPAPPPAPERAAAGAEDTGMAETAFSALSQAEPAEPAAAAPLDASVEAATRGVPEGAVDEAAKLELLKAALHDGDTDGLRLTLIEVTGLPIRELRIRRHKTMDPRSWVSPLGAPRVKNEFDTPLLKLIVAADVRLERWEGADRVAARREQEEARGESAFAECRNKWCGCCLPEKRLHKPSGAKPHNQRSALEKKKMLGRSTLDEIDIPDFYDSPERQTK